MPRLMYANYFVMSLKVTQGLSICALYLFTKRSFSKRNALYRQNEMKRRRENPQTRRFILILFLFHVFFLIRLRFGWTSQCEWTWALARADDDERFARLMEWELQTLWNDFKRIGKSISSISMTLFSSFCETIRSTSFPDFVRLCSWKKVKWNRIYRKIGIKLHWLCASVVVRITEKKKSIWIECHFISTRIVCSLIFDYDCHKYSNQKFIYAN